MKKGDFVKAAIEGYAFEGKGIAKVDKDPENPSDKKYVIFVSGSYPGDVVEAQLTKVKRSYAEARLVKVIEDSPERVTAPCQYFGTCGGCKQQDLDYDHQLKYKQMQVKEIFERMGKQEDFEMLPIIPSEREFFYRNKMEYSFSNKRWLTPEEINSDKKFDNYFSLGLHIPRIYDKVLDIYECFLQSETSNKILNFTRDFFKSRGISIYSTDTHEGYLRNLVIKQSHHTNDLMVNLVTSEEDNEIFPEYASRLKFTVPEVTTVINNINLKKAQIAVGDYEKVAVGEGVIFDMIGNYKFRISANSFFQTNSLQAKHLYQVALDFAELTGEETVYDLYSGAGTISIFISKHAKDVVGFESVESAVEDAKVNADLNDVYNTHFFLADLNKSFLQLLEDNDVPKPNVIVADPPRSGMNPKTVKDILKLLPEKIVYVSCNPTTQIRDIVMLTEDDEYELVKVQPVDMFPHTYHIENVALLRKKN